MKKISTSRYSKVESTFLIIRAGSMAISLILVWQALGDTGRPADEMSFIMLRALYPLIFGISVGLWQDRWEHRHTKIPGEHKAYE